MGNEVITLQNGSKSGVISREIVHIPMTMISGDYSTGLDVERCPTLQLQLWSNLFSSLFTTASCCAFTLRFNSAVIHDCNFLMHLKFMWTQAKLALSGSQYQGSKVRRKSDRSSQMIKICFGHLMIPLTVSDIRWRIPCKSSSHQALAAALGGKSSSMASAVLIRRCFWAFGEIFPQVWCATLRRRCSINVNY